MAISENQRNTLLEPLEVTWGGPSRGRIFLLIVLFIFGATLSGLLHFEHHGVLPQSGIIDQTCGGDVHNSCAKVLNSPYSSIAGIPLAALGLFFYASLALLMCISLSTTKEVQQAAATLLLYCIAFALGVNIILFGLQIFVLGTYCKLCLATYAINTAALIIVLPAKNVILEIVDMWRKASSGYATLVAWGVGCVAILIFIGLIEYVLSSVHSAQNKAILDALSNIDTKVDPEISKTGMSDSRAVSVGSTQPSKNDIFLEKRLTQAKNEINRLQGILDNKKQYQQYVLEKHTKQFQKASPQQLNLANKPFKGSIDAPLQLVGYSDFLCPYCRSLAAMLNKYQMQPESNMVIFFKNYPLDQTCNPNLRRSVHPGACNLALGAICAQNQNRFWDYHDKVFQQPPKNASVEKVVNIGVSIGLESQSFTSCLASRTTHAELADEIFEAKRLSVNSTPTLFLNNKKLPNAGILPKAIESESKRLGL